MALSLFANMWLVVSPKRLYCYLKTHDCIISIGSYGTFHRERLSRWSYVNVISRKKVGIKLKKQSASLPQLYLEYGFYRDLGNTDFISKVLNFGPIANKDADVSRQLECVRWSCWSPSHCLEFNSIHLITIKKNWQFTMGHLCPKFVQLTI